MSDDEPWDPLGLRERISRNKVRCDGCNKLINKRDGVKLLGPPPFGGNLYCAYTCPGLPQ